MTTQCEACGAVYDDVTDKCKCSKIKPARPRHKGVDRLRKRWRNMRDRCEKPKHRYWANYGGRGITVCPEWNDYENFRSWALSNGFEHELTLDRKDNDKGYSPENCRWITHAEQQRNRTSNTHVFVAGKRMTLAEVCETYNMSSRLLSWRLSVGWTIEEAISIPPAPENSVIHRRESDFIKIERLEKSLARAREALEFYASKSDCWFAHCDDMSDDLTALNEDKGATARECLKEIE